MILIEGRERPVWLFTDEECADYAYICSCLPFDRLSQREQGFLRELEISFRKSRGGHVTQGRWDWFVILCDRWGSFIQNQQTGIAAMRALAAQGGQPDG